MLRLSLAIIIMAALTGCATANPYQVTGGKEANATVSATSGLAYLANGVVNAYIKGINGAPVQNAATTVLLPPGHYKFAVTCSSASMNLSGYGNFEFDAEAGHQYQFAADPSATIAGACQLYLYDSTDGRDAYSETVHLTLDKSEAGKWHSGGGSGNAGHSVADTLPKGQDQDNWKQMIEIESWIKLTYPDTAESFFQQQLANAKQQCPDAKYDVLSESPDDVIYTFDMGAGCARSDVRWQYGRFMTGKFGVYHAVLISRIAVDDAQQAMWAKVMHDATILDEK